jgi:hypothetical protein
LSPQARVVTPFQRVTHRRTSLRKLSGSTRTAAKGIPDDRSARAHHSVRCPTPLMIGTRLSGFPAAASATPATWELSAVQDSGDRECPCRKTARSLGLSLPLPLN